MPTSIEISNRIQRGQLLQAYYAKSYVVQENVGQFFNFWDKAVYVSQLVDGLLTQYVDTNYYGVITNTLYNKLGLLLGMKYMDGINLDPNAQHTDGVIFGRVTPILDLAFTIPSGTNIPYTYDMVSNPGYGNEPFVQELVKGTGNRKDDYSDIQVGYVYSDTDMQLLQSIQIFGHDDGTGKFAQDTYIRIKASTISPTRFGFLMDSNMNYITTTNYNKLIAQI